MFLEELAKYIIDNESGRLKDICFIFPNRRSGLFFKRFLVKHQSSVSWSPRIITIQELMQSLSGMEASDTIDLLFELYDIYRASIKKPESFDVFYPWGEMMINDFDTVDKYLVDSESIFQNIAELKEIDRKFGGLTEEQVSYIKQFWENFHQDKTSDEQEQFLSIWSLLPVIYKKFASLLIEKSEGYEGLIYRKSAELNESQLGKAIEYAHYYFVGFNALSKAEKLLFSKLKRKGIASFFWDYDINYLEDQSMEAGRFIRENIEAFPPPASISNFNSLQNLREIRILDLPSDVLQAKMVHKLVNDHASDTTDPNDTAIVLCDENLLMPVLVSLPESIDEVNVTMGYPFRSTPLNGFIDSILRLHLHARHRSDGGVRFYYRDVLSVLNHTYYSMISDDDEKSEKQKLISENYVYVQEDFFSSDFAMKIFISVDKTDAFADYLKSLFEYILDYMRKVPGKFYHQLEMEYLMVILSRLNKLSDSFKQRPDLEIKTFIRFFKRILVQLRIPFSGEPLAGLQVMGILETRLLDFRNIIMLSVNEEIMPASSSMNTFIPYSLRYAFDIPVREDMDAIYAYYFYRLIQRARKIDLIYKSSAEGIRTGEMSRYLYQMKYLFGAETISPVLSVTAVSKREIVIPKTDKIFDILDKYTSASDEENYLSPSSLNTYLECSLKFYFRKISGIGESEELLEELDAIGFGNILHNTIHKLYKDFINKSGHLEIDDLKRLIRSKDIDNVLLVTFKREFFKSDSNRAIEGRNLIIYEILRKYIIRIIETDMQLTPFKLIDLEESYADSRKIKTGSGDKEIRIGGKIDRVDRLQDGTIRIIDYKTGSTEMEIKDIEAVFDKEDKKRNKEAFQAFIYASMYLENNPQTKVRPGLYSVKQLYGDDFSPYFSIKEPEKKELLNFNELKAYFDTLLDNLLVEIYDRDLPFTQTEVRDRCKYCDFRTICDR